MNTQTRWWNLTITACLVALWLTNPISVLKTPQPLSSPEMAVSAAGDTWLVSRRTDGVQSNGKSYDTKISADGLFVVFTSEATNLVAGDSTNKDVFVRNLTTNETTLISKSSSGAKGNGDSEKPSISGDGRYIAFTSRASNLVTGDTNGAVQDIFVHDRTTGITTLVSVTSEGVQGLEASINPSISANGSLVAFTSHSRLAPGDAPMWDDIFVHDRARGQTILASISWDNKPAENGASSFPAISANGQFVVFESPATNLVQGGTNGKSHVFMRDLFEGENTLISKSTAGVQGDDSSMKASVSANGRFVVFSSKAYNLAPDTNSFFDVFRHDNLTHETVRVSNSTGGTQPNNESGDASINGDGRYVAFSSSASNLIIGDGNGFWDVFVKDMQTGSTQRISVSSTGAQGNADSFFGRGGQAIDEDGRIVVFYSLATLVAGDANNMMDVFGHEVLGPLLGLIKVRDEEGNPVWGAQVYRSGMLAGTTDAYGRLILPDLQTNDQLVARKLIKEVATPKNAHNLDSSQNWAYRVYITSMDIPQNNNPQPHLVSNLDLPQVLTIKIGNPLIGFNLVASLEWDANTAYLAELQQGFENASTYLYDATNGQMLFERMSLYDNNLHMDDSDYQVRASNQEWPRGHLNSLLVGGSVRKIILGRYWSGKSSNTGSWTQLDGFRTMIHEFGHYGFDLYDSYKYKNFLGMKMDGDCTSFDIRENFLDRINATLMDYQYNASELSMINVPIAWNDECLNTDQWQKHSQSDWETIVSGFGDKETPQRWQIKTPASYGGIIAGPDNIPVPVWSRVNIGSNAQTGVCEPPVIYQFKTAAGIPSPDDKVWLKKSDRTIYQGITDSNGKITIFGASNGDQLIVNLFGFNLSYNSYTVFCALAPSAGYSNDISTEPIEVILQPAEFLVELQALPGAGAGELQVKVSASVALANPPQVSLTQYGSTTVTVPVSYDAGEQAYLGTVTLDAAYSPFGTLLARAVDTAAHVVEAITQFNLEPAEADQETIIWSGDGQVELTIPSGALSVDGAVTIQLDQAAPPLPANKVLVSGPYQITASQGVSLVNPADLTFYFLGNNLDPKHIDPLTYQVYHWDGSNWVGLDGTMSAENNFTFAKIPSFGTYALAVDRLEKVFLPFIQR